MASLPDSLQPRFEQLFARLLQRAHVTAKRGRWGSVDEVDWIEKFYALVTLDLEDDLRTSLRGGGTGMSVAVNAALLHGRPFQAWPRWSHYHSARSIEIGDLMIIGELHAPTKHPAAREALLLQMKVGVPSLQGPVRGTVAQAELYATWPQFNWSKKIRAMLPGTFPRTPESETTRATQFGIIPPENLPHAASGHDAYRVALGPSLKTPSPLEVSLARALRLDTGVDATPSSRSNGWPRIVEDIIETAPLYRFRGQQRFESALGPLERTRMSGSSDDDAAGPDMSTSQRGKPFAIVQVGFGPQGLLD